jgi:hypothetical protein
MRLRNLIAGALVAFGLAACTSVRADDVNVNVTQGDNVILRYTYRVMARSIETVDPDAWKPIVDKQQAQNVKSLKEFAEKALVDNKITLGLVETPHFLIYTDLTAMDANQDAMLLESGYAVMGRILNLTPAPGPKPKTQGTNLFRGKMVYFIFRETRAHNAQQFALKLHPTEQDSVLSDQLNDGPWAVLTMNGNGACDVVAAADNNMNSQFPLVRSMAIASLYRYHSPKPLPLWIQDGVAFGVAGSIAYTPDTASDPNRVQDRQRQLDQNSKMVLNRFGKDVDYFLDPNPHVDECSMLYDDLVTFMYHQSSARFDAFLLGMKDGLDWQKSLETKYGINRDRLVTAFTAVLNAAPG